MKINIMDIIKDVITSILVIACIVLVLAVFFYDKIALSKVIPESEDYVLTEQMKQELKDNNLESAKEVIVNYYIDSSELKKYENTKEYDKGKSNPFGAVEKSSNQTSNGSNNTSSTNNNTTDSENFYEDDGTK